jgi:7-cyano-7-deazaguanine reductase
LSVASVATGGIGCRCLCASGKIIFYRVTIMASTTTALPPLNAQGLDVRSTPREEMSLYPLDTFAYEFAGREIRINFEIPEFTAVCPFSDFPDFGTIRLQYVPNERCVELKSLKLYINSFRKIRIFHEHAVNVILEDFVRACDPISVEIEGDFNIRGNIKTVVRADYKRSK